MYERVQRSPNSTRLAGASIAVIVTAMVGYALTTGIVQSVVKAPEKIMEVVMLAPEVSEPVETPKLETPTDVELKQPDLFVPLPEFVADELPPIVAAVTEVAPAIETPAPVMATPSGSGRIAPKLRADGKPPYPAASLRAQEHGTTAMEVCVSDSGRVTSATLAKSSGYVRLDEAALKWIRTQRFSPGSVGGVTQSMCGHKVDNLWNLEDAR